IALGDEALEEREPLGAFEVDRDAFLVPIDAQKIRALAADEWWTPCARVVAFAGLLDLDHARAHVAEHHRAIRARQHAREVENGYAVERCFGRWGHEGPFVVAMESANHQTLGLP